MKYRKKPVVIEAVQWVVNIECEEKLRAWGCPFVAVPMTDRLIIPTLEGDMKCEAWDYIIKGIKGEFYPVKPDIFEMTYEAVEE